jgi:hypothetical protein
MRVSELGESIRVEEDEVGVLMQPFTSVDLENQEPLSHVHGPLVLQQFAMLPGRIFNEAILFRNNFRSWIAALSFTGGSRVCSVFQVQP